MVAHHHIGEGGGDGGSLVVMMRIANVVAKRRLNEVAGRVVGVDN